MQNIPLRYIQRILRVAGSFNPALNLAPFGRWTLRDKAAQRRLARRSASQTT
jgi:hypothetical protein